MSSLGHFLVQVVPFFIGSKWIIQHSCVAAYTLSLPMSTVRIKKLSWIFNYLDIRPFWSLDKKKYSKRSENILKPFSATNASSFLPFWPNILRLEHKIPELNQTFICRVCHNICWEIHDFNFSTVHFPNETHPLRNVWGLRSSRVAWNQSHMEIW